jgi:hypothetical protein
MYRQAVAAACYRSIVWKALKLNFQLVYGLKQAEPVEVALIKFHILTTRQKIRVNLWHCEVCITAGALQNIDNNSICYQTTMFSIKTLTV